MTKRILVVDDEPAVNDLICDALRLASYDTVSAGHGMEALTVLREQRIDLAIVDVNMPVMSGYDLLERMRSSGIQTPVIVLTARQEREDTRTSFGLGADDFVRKPFGIEELTLRVTAILRRSGQAESRNVRTIGRITIDDDAHEVRLGDLSIELSPTEYRLLSVLAANPGRVLTREQLLDQVWGLGPGLESTAVETYVSYLRRKFGDDLVIRTVRGIGYQLMDPRS
jgi:two-component system, OmpR family, response regulator